MFCGELARVEHQSAEAGKAWRPTGMHRRVVVLLALILGLMVVGGRQFYDSMVERANIREAIAQLNDPSECYPKLRTTFLV